MWQSRAEPPELNPHNALENHLKDGTSSWNHVSYVNLRTIWIVTWEGESSRSQGLTSWGDCWPLSPCDGGCSRLAFDLGLTSAGAVILENSDLFGSLADILKVYKKDQKGMLIHTHPKSIRRLRWLCHPVAWYEHPKHLRLHGLCPRKPAHFRQARLGVGCHCTSRHKRGILWSTQWVAMDRVWILGTFQFNWS